MPSPNASLPRPPVIAARLVWCRVPRLIKPDSCVPLLLTVGCWQLPCPSFKLANLLFLWRVVPPPDIGIMKPKSALVALRKVSRCIWCYKVLEYRGTRQPGRKRFPTRSVNYGSLSLSLPLSSFVGVVPPLATWKTSVLLSSERSVFWWTLLSMTATAVADLIRGTSFSRQQFMT